MILEGNQRGNGEDLALHLVKDRSHPDGNDHVELLEIRGVPDDTIMGALLTMEAMSAATQCKKHLYSCSLNPPEECENPPLWYFHQAAELIEQRQGLHGQPRILVLHEKDGRTHAHAVWSRIYFNEEKQKMMAIEMPFDRRIAHKTSSELFDQHGWEKPKGFEDGVRGRTTNYTRGEFYEYKRSGIDPTKLKTDIKDAYTASDNLEAMQAALRDRGFILCHGKRGYLALDMMTLKTTAITRATGLKIEVIRGKLDPENQLNKENDNKPVIQSWDSAKKGAARLMTAELKAQFDKTKVAQKRELAPLEKVRDEMVIQQQKERQALKQEQERLARQQAITRAIEYKKGLAGILDIASGKRRKLKEERDAKRQALNESQAKEMAELRGRNLADRRVLKAQAMRIKDRHQAELREFRHAAAYYISHYKDEQGRAKPKEKPPLEPVKKAPEKSTVVNFVLPDRPPDKRKESVKKQRDKVASEQQKAFDKVAKVKPEKVIDRQEKAVANDAPPPREHKPLPMLKSMNNEAPKQVKPAFKEHSQPEPSKKPETLNPEKPWRQRKRRPRPERSPERGPDLGR